MKKEDLMKKFNSLKTKIVATSKVLGKKSASLMKTLGTKLKALMQVWGVKLKALMKVIAAQLKILFAYLAKELKIFLKFAGEKLGIFIRFVGRKIAENQAIQVALVLLVSIGLGFLFQSSALAHNIGKTYATVDTGVAQFPQEVVSINEVPVEINKLYLEGQLIGIVKDEKRLDSLFNQVYQNEYQEDFPDSKLGFTDDVYQTKELSYNTYQNRDDEIFQYLHDEDLFAIETNKISFSNGAVIYVKDKADFDAARESFILNFISEDTYTRLRNEDALPPLDGYGNRDMSFNVEETVSFTKGLASKDQILQSKESVQSFLSYGYSPDIQTYQVKPLDTVPGIAMLNGMNVSQLQILNPNIVDEDQLIEVGSDLNITKFNSPFTVEVEKERKTQEAVYPEEPIYQEDPNLKEGLEQVDVKEQHGSRDVVYHDTFINGVNTESKEISSTVTRQPVRAVIRRGTYVEPRVGSGNYQWPVSNGYVMCGYGCYAGHRGVDFGVYGGSHGQPIYAIDRGVVTTSTYSPSWGYYVKIDHGNGYQSLYAHMMAPGIGAGVTVGRGAYIGNIGQTGFATAPHVHLELYSGGSRINACIMLGC